MRDEVEPSLTQVADITSGGKSEPLEFKATTGTRREVGGGCYGTVPEFGDYYRGGGLDKEAREVDARLSKTPAHLQ